MSLCIIQARMNSTRLPGKVIKQIISTPMILLQIERLKRSSGISELIVATSVEESDDVLVEILENAGVPVYRGSLENVHQRFLCLLEDLGSTEKDIIRITADCPLIDPEIIDRCIVKFKSGDYDYLSNSLFRTFPRGLDVEIFKKDSLMKASQIFLLSNYQKEHVTPVFYQNPDYFKLGSFENILDYSNLRWTVDTQKDFDFVGQVYENLYNKKKDFNMNDILEFLNMNPTISNFEDLN
jgi:spore coat polysaccharide biosynthesis protein SpsF